MKISFIGGGNMARALIQGLKQNGFSMADVHVIEPDGDKRAALQRDFGVATSENLPNAANADIIVIAVKPQQMRDVCIFLSSLLQRQLVISIAAGLRTQDISRWLGGYENIVRVMPNTPAQIQAGISALYAMSAVTSSQHVQAENIMKAVGEIIWLEDEQQMDAVTAISGSGPAYVFYFMEAMLQAAAELGLSPEQARALCMHTMQGASRLAAASVESPAELRAQVTSKGGTTEQAIMAMEGAGVKSAIVKAARAAADKSRELGDLLGKN
ncbi:MAG TPA: pyrroline-5-carboxylate reductase [Methylophilaceae bacterium]|nr:pyrroline-5-carboxylate reductase [Methylophilaceae bacterium]